jgi:hypothetical protein
MSAGVASADPPAPPPEPKTSIDHDGTYSVGTDIAPGTYSSAGPVQGATCYWKRLGGQGGTDTVDNAMSKKPQTVNIDPGDKAFKTDGCQPWHLANADVQAPGGLPPLIAGAQLHSYIDSINAGAGQAGAGQVPRP